MDAVIVDVDTLRAVGLRHILEERHGLNAVITTDPTTLEAIPEKTLFFVTPEAFASRPYFYVPRRERVTLISRLHHAPLPVVNPEDGYDAIAHGLDAIVGRFGAFTPPTALSARETDVLRLIACGLINKEIADRLGISFNTVLSHRKNISAKLGLRNVSALTIYAVMNGLVDPSETQANDQHTEPDC